jgi:hypothetical protein
MPQRYEPWQEVEESALASGVTSRKGLHGPDANQSAALNLPLNCQGQSPGTIPRSRKRILRLVGRIIFLKSPREHSFMDGVSNG